MSDLAFKKTQRISIFDIKYIEQIRDKERQKEFLGMMIYTSERKYEIYFKTKEICDSFFKGLEYSKKYKAKINESLQVSR